MKNTLLALLLLLSVSPLGLAAELEALSKRFIDSAQRGDSEGLTKIYLNGPTRTKAVTAFMEIFAQVKKKELKISRIENELIIGDLGVALIRVESVDHREPRYRPFICVRTSKGWRAYPWFNEADLKLLYEQRTPEEQIHLKLFNKWGNLMGELLKKQAEQDAAPDGE